MISAGSSPSRDTSERDAERDAAPELSSSMRHSVEEFLSLPLSDEVKRKVLFDNAAALFPG